MRRTSPRRERGLTIIELALTISIVGLVVLGSLMVYETVVTQHKIATAVSDAAAVRAAVLRWAAGGPIAFPDVPRDGGDGTVPSPMNLDAWNDLAEYLPEHLRAQAETTTTKTLAAANPWNGNYVLTSISPSTPNRWALQIGKVPDDVCPAFSKKLGRMTATVTDDCTAAGDSHTTVVTFDE